MNVVDGNLLIRASAGSGKTYQLGNRVIGRVASGVDPEKIVALTFTRKAAGEFADSVLGKLAAAALDDVKAVALGDDIKLPEADFQMVLQAIVRSLPKFTLTTIDSFFARVVRGFQYELGLTGGRFELLEGPRAAAERDALLGDLLGRTLDEGSAGDFARAFRRATAGKEGVAVRANLRGFVEEWYQRFCEGGTCIWGPNSLLTTKPVEWEARKHELADAARASCEGIQEHRKGQIDQVLAFIDRVEAYVLSGGGFPNASKVAAGILDALEAGYEGDLELQFHKTFVLPANALSKIGSLVRLAVNAEMSAAVLRTRAIAKVLENFDSLVRERLRRRGLLGFDDVKRLMGAWQRDEDARLRRELVDFRLDARHEHWLLDEFQDTSREEWNGLLPLLHEAVQGGRDGSLFIVGDRKQAIYGWRGGDVGLFDEIRNTFGQGIRTEPMAESWRSSPEVLELVNRVCGNNELIEQMFGIGSDRWEWDPHVSAPILRDPARAGEACVEVLDFPKNEVGAENDEAPETLATDPRVIRMIARMKELGVGEKEMSCGVLVRRNQDGNEIADVLREVGFDVVQDGVRKPAKDHPAGVAAWQLLRWLANPDDSCARIVLQMSPLISVLRPSEDVTWFHVWEKLQADVWRQGYAKAVENLFRPIESGMSAYGRRRIAEILDALSAYDAAGVGSASGAADWLERLEVPQNPGAAAIQVMTIHKSKGLGFDVVFIPLLPDTRIPETQRYRVAEGDGWLTEVPPAWARRFFPEIRNAEAKWAADEAYEALCQLYVALTRAKRGLYVYLAKKPRSPDAEAPTLTNWMLRELGSDGTPGVVFQMGNPDWVNGVKPRTPSKSPADGRVLGSPVPRRRRSRPSQKVDDDVVSQETRSGIAHRGIAFGTAVHACFERIGWLEDCNLECLPDTDAGRLVMATLEIPEIAELFRKPPGHVVLHREQLLDALVDGSWLSGVVDRMHVHHTRPGGPVSRVEIIDFKTDAVDNPDTLLAKHSKQMRAYGKVIASLYPGASIELVLVSTALKKRIAADDTTSG